VKRRKEPTEKKQAKKANSARVTKELRECKKDQELTGITAASVGGSLSHITGTLKGPDDSPYEGGLFIVDIMIPGSYPFEPPKMKFSSKIWHPNVSSQTGAICLDILKDQWSPALTIKTAMLSLQALLSMPEPDDPQDAVVATMYKSDIDKFNSTARFWTETYARAKEVEAKAAQTDQPISANQIEGTLEGDAAPAQAPAAVAEEKQAGCCALVMVRAQEGDEVVVHKGPCCCWICNVLVCPCWASKPTKVTQER
jgi:ubiquitin-conjugating enzyme (huntingtin interacting protein 2)